MNSAVLIEASRAIAAIGIFSISISLSACARTFPFKVMMLLALADAGNVSVEWLAAGRGGKSPGGLPEGYADPSKLLQFYRVGVPTHTCRIFGIRRPGVSGDFRSHLFANFK